MFTSLFKSEKPHQNTSNIIRHKTVNRNYESLMYNKNEKTHFQFPCLIAVFIKTIVLFGEKNKKDSTMPRVDE